MGFISPSSKIERAVRAFLVLQGKADDASTFISNDGRVRMFPNRTILATGFSPTSPKRPDGRVSFEVRHHFAAPGGDDGSQRAAMDAYVGASADSLMVSDGDSMNAVADAITAAGRWLAQTDNTPAGDLVAAQNADMASFRCDWIKLSDPFLTRGRVEADDGKAHWVEVLNFMAFVSQATN